MIIFIRRANLVPCYVCYVVFLSILRRRAEKLEEFREDIVSPRVDVTFLSNFKLRPYAVRTFLNYFFSTSAPSRPNLLSITGIKMMVSRSSQSSESVSGYSTKFIWGDSDPKSNHLPFYKPILAWKVPLSKTFYWQMVPLSWPILELYIIF